MPPRLGLRRPGAAVIPPRLRSAGRTVTKMEVGRARVPPPFWAGGPAPGQTYVPGGPGPVAGVLPFTRTL